MGPKSQTRGWGTVREKQSLPEPPTLSSKEVDPQLGLSGSTIQYQSLRFDSCIQQQFNKLPVRRSFDLT